MRPLPRSRIIPHTRRRLGPNNDQRFKFHPRSHPFLPLMIVVAGRMAERHTPSSSRKKQAWCISQLLLSRMADRVDLNRLPCHAFLRQVHLGTGCSPLVIDSARGRGYGKKCQRGSASSARRTDPGRVIETMARNARGAKKPHTVTTNKHTHDANTDPSQQTAQRRTPPWALAGKRADHSRRHGKLRTHTGSFLVHPRDHPHNCSAIAAGVTGMAQCRPSHRRHVTVMGPQGSPEEYSTQRNVPTERRYDHMTAAAPIMAATPPATCTVGDTRARDAHGRRLVPERSTTMAAGVA